MIGTYWEYLAMIMIGLMAIACWLYAWDSSKPMAVRWSSFVYGLVLMAFELCIIAVDVKVG